jgi:hypothetical protein
VALADTQLAVPNRCHAIFVRQRMRRRKQKKPLHASDLLGGRTRARTWDPLIKSQLLYQLSYAPGTYSGKAFARGRRLASRPPDVQQTGGDFPTLLPDPEQQISRRIPAAYRSA